MKLKLLFFLFGISTFHITIAQNDTIWYNNSWGETTKANAAYYRPDPEAKDDGFWIVDYYVSGVKQMEGFSKRKDMEIFVGEVSWFTEEGTVYQRAHYKNGFLNGEFITYANGKEVAKAIYKNEKVESGTTLQYFPDYDYHILREYQNGKVVKYVLYQEAPDDGIRVEGTYGAGEKENFSNAKFYDRTGALIGALTASVEYPYNTSYYNGTQVVYYYKPMRIKSETVYKKGFLQSAAVFYPSGKIRERVTVKNDTAFTSYFDESGKTLAKLSSHYIQSDSDGDPWSEGVRAVKENAIDGTKITFKQNRFSFGLQKITSTTTYKNEKIEEHKDFYENGALKESKSYEKGVIAKLEVYTEDGETAGQLTYKDGKPYNGIDRSGKTAKIYENGQLVENTKTYADGTLLKKETDNEVIYYDKDGEKMGKLVYKLNKYGHKKPYSGDEYHFLKNGQVSFIKSYKNGKRTTIVYFNIRNGKGLGDQPIKEKVVYYNTEGERSQEEHFYENGQRQADIIYKGYAKERATYYDKKGRKLSTMVFQPEKNGTQYVLIPKSDLIYAVETYREGKLTYEKKFDKDYRSRDVNGEHPVYLQKEIDYNGKASFYNTQNRLIAEATYKNGDPWKGKVVKGGAYQYTITSYKNGKKKGGQVQYYNPKYGEPIIRRKRTYLNDKLHGKAYAYFDNGEPRSIESYKNGILDGEVIHYSENGTERNKLIYKNGAPYEGLFINKSVKSRYITTTEKAYYKAGTLTKTEDWRNNQLLLEAYIAENQLRATEYDDSGRKAIFYNMTDIKNKNGEIIYYDKSGTEIEKGTIIEGRPASGVFYLKKFLLFPEEKINTIKLEVTKEAFTLYGLDQNMEEVVHISESRKGLDLFFLDTIDRMDYFYNDIVEPFIK